MNTKKQAYKSPSFFIYGDLAALTNSNDAFKADDTNPNFPGTYTSPVSFDSSDRGDFAPNGARGGSDRGGRQ